MNTGVLVLIKLQRPRVGVVSLLHPGICLHTHEGVDHAAPRRLRVRLAEDRIVDGPRITTNGKVQGRPGRNEASFELFNFERNNEDGLREERAT